MNGIFFTFARLFRQSSRLARHLGYGFYRPISMVERRAIQHNRSYFHGSARKPYICFALSYAVSTTTSEEEQRQNEVIEPSLSATDARYDKKPVGDGYTWEKIVHDDEVAVYRRWINNLGVYEYRCAGTYTDISAKNFVRAQMDPDYRKEWDNNAGEIKVVNVADDGLETVKWVHKFPRPMSPRLYVYERRTEFDETTQSIQIDSEVIDEDKWPTDGCNSGCVRVHVYRSRLRVRAHKKFDENGLDYTLTYYDHPRAAIPGPAYNWILNSAGPYFLKDVHAAAKRLC